MKNDLTCAVVRDLLPSYVEGLTARETARAVEAHLADCPACAARHAAMAAPAEQEARETREVDYLKAVKRQNRRRVVLAAVCAVAVIFACMAAKLFLIGESAGAAGMMRSITYDAQGQTLHLEVHATESAMAYTGWTQRREGDAVYLAARKVAASPLNRSGSYETDVSLAEGVRSVYLGGDLLWQDGVVIYQNAGALYETRTPYVGDAPALGRIVSLLQSQGHPISGFSNELQTTREPYGWTLVYDRGFLPEAEASLNQQMERTYAPLLLALVGNLGEVSWTYQTQDGVQMTGTVTLAEADAELPALAAAYTAESGIDATARDSVKDYLGSAAEFQELWNLLGLH